MSHDTETSVIAVFNNNSDAQAAADDLKNNGIDSDDIYIGSYDTSTQDAAAQTGYSESRTHHREGGFIGWLKSIFGSDEDDPDRYQYEQAARSGKIVLSVSIPEEQAEYVADILDRHSPVDVQEGVAAAASASASGVGTRPQTSGARNVGAQTGSAQAAGTRQGISTTGSEQSVPIVQEELRVGKRSVVRGGVRVYTRLVEQPVEESVRLREEQVRVDRQPVNRPVSEGDLRGREEQVVEVKEYTEEPVISKEARVVEEVRIGKNATERTETVRDTVRRTEVEVENLKDKAADRKPAGSDTGDDVRSKSAKR